MRLLLPAILLCLAVLTTGRRPASNCGLSCFRYQKCMGTLDGSHGNRPGQLGDTGIIVLQHCGPLKKKGCECDVEEEEEILSETTSSLPSTRFSKTKPKPRSFRPRASNVRSIVRTNTTPTTTSTTERSNLRALFGKRSRIYRSKRLIGGNQRY